MGKESEPRQFRSRLIQRFLSRRLKEANVNYEVVGVENLNRVRELLENGASITAELNHPAYADLPTGAAIVLKEGLDDLMPRSRVAIADRYVNNPLLAIPVRGLCWVIGLKTLAVKSHRFGGDKKNPKMNAEALRKIREDAPGTIAIATPEGTHTGGEMKAARWGAARWWEGRDYLEPVALRKTEAQWRGGLLGFVRYIRKGRKEERATVIFGEPVLVENMERVAEVYTQGDPDPKALRRNRVDFPTLLIVNLHNEYVRQRGLEDNPEETKYTKGYYETRLQELAEHPVSVTMRQLARMADARPKQHPEAQEEKTAEKKRATPKPFRQSSLGWI